MHHGFWLRFQQRLRKRMWSQREVGDEVDTDPVLAAVAALRAAGIKAIPTGNDMELWQIGDLIYLDADVLQLAESCGPVEDGVSR